MARLVFIVFCLLPTLGVASWAWYWRSAAHAQRWEAELAHWLRVDVRLESVEHPRPGVVRLRGVRLADAETGADVLHASAVEIRWAAELLELELAQAEVFAERAERLVQMIRELLAHKPRGLPSTLTLRATELSFSRAGLKYSAKQVAGGMRLVPEASVFELAFIPREGGAKPARLKVVRDRRGVPHYSLSVSTGEAGLTCAWLVPEAAEWLGSEARVRGSATLWYTEQGWSGQLAGELENVDLHRLVSGHFSHQLTGKARLELEELVIEQGRIVQAAGTLHSGPGLISRSLLAAGGQALGLVSRAAALPPSNKPLVAYTQLACGFTIGPEGLVLSGRASDALPGAILVDTYRPLWTEPLLQPQHAAALVRMLVPQGDDHVPATRAAERLLRWLPLGEEVEPRDQPP